MYVYMYMYACMYVCERHGVVDKALDYQPQGREFDPRCLLTPCRFTTDYSVILSGIIVVVAGLVSR